MWYNFNNIDLSSKTILERRDFLLRLVLIGFSLGVLLILIKWLFFDRSWVTTDNAFVTGNLININSDATGVIEQIFAEETQLVKKDDILVKLDGQRAAASLGQAEADLARAVRSVGALFASRRQVCQKINSRSASRERTRHDIVRFKYAVPSGAASPQQLQNSEDQLAAQEADIKEAKAELTAIEVRIAGRNRSNHPDIESSKSKFLDAYIETIRQNIRAPVAGYMAKRRVQVGQRVKPGDLVANIVPLNHLWVEANIWENRLEYVRPGQEVIIKPDIYGGKKVYHGRVDGLIPGTGSVFATLPPDNATGNFIRIVQRVPVRIALDHKELETDPLRPGLSTIASINVSGGVKSPNSAITTTSYDEYKTEIYKRDLMEAKAKAEKVIAENLYKGKEDIDQACSLEIENK